MQRISELIRQSSSADNRLNLAMSAEVAAYMTLFGYLDKSSTFGEIKSYLPDMIKSAQGILGLSQDGEVGEVTHKSMMTTPRCGCLDVQRIGLSNTNQWFKRKAKEGLSYHIVRYVRGLSESLQEDIFIRAWSSWERVCGVKLIRRRDTNADIIIDAGASRREELGTVGNVLAFAYLPQGDRHTRQLLCKFDLAETWIDDPRMRGILLENVAAHEFGHLLGEGHTRIRGELLYPTYDKRVKHPQPQYDIPAAVLRYDSPVDPNPIPPDDDDVKIEGSIRIDGISYELCRKTA